MPESNLFTMLSAFHPGSTATPFENYCTSGLAYFLKTGHRMLTALFAEAASAHGEPLALVEVQPRLADAGIADLLLTFEGGRRALIEVHVEPGADEGALPGFEAVAGGWSIQPAFVILGVWGTEVRPPWRPVTWLQVVEALEDDPDPMARQFTEFILRDILGLGDVSLDQAVSTNRLYALGGAAVRRAFGETARYVNSASRPMAGRYRYLGTTFAPNGEHMDYWIGIVNEALPLTEHYHLMLASKSRPVELPTDHPRATGDWKWEYWTGRGRVVRPITAEAYGELLARLL
ncbi:MAG: hypothetical protein C0506_07425 [Anaerolinea sp.]|nr:hypothetical protein [Anaerolinea sp.]